MFGGDDGGDNDNDDDDDDVCSVLVGMMVGLNLGGLAGLRKNGGFLPVPDSWRQRMKLRDKYQYCLLVRGRQIPELSSGKRSSGRFAEVLIPDSRRLVLVL